jgi:hypothetical protein
MRAIGDLAGVDAGFSISFDPSAEGTEHAGEARAGEPMWLELLAKGLTFDLVGLAPGPACESPPRTHDYALAADADAAGVQAVTLRPGPHLAGGHTLLPVVRSLAALGASLATLDGVVAVAWHPARTWCGPGYFRDGVVRWIEGGVFPGLGLTALAMTPDGGMQSEGLALFAGQDLRIEPELMTEQSAGAKIGLRLIDFLVDAGPIEAPRRLPGPDGQPLRLEPSANGRFVRVWRGQAGQPLCRGWR